MYQEEKMSKNTKFGIIAIVAFVVIIIAGLIFVRIKSINGNEVGVKETWSEGVANKPLTPKTYVYFPVSEEIFVYPTNSQVFCMNNRKENDEFAEGRRVDAYECQSQEGQSMKISLNVRYHLDPEKIIDLHKTVRDNFEERLLRPEIMRIVKDAATTRTALVAYSGQGLVDLQNEIFHKLSDKNSDLYNRGVVVENFVIEEINLDPKYVEQIQAKQVAVQQSLRLIEETKAANQAAEKAKATAQADFEKAVVEAKRDKETGILNAQKEAQQQILAAEAAKTKAVLAAEAQKASNVLAAQGEQESGLLRAQAIEALGKAEASATKQKLQAYAVTGADAYVKIQVAESMSHAFGGIKGYLPEKMTVNLLADQYDKAVNVLINSSVPTPVAAQ